VSVSAIYPTQLNPTHRRAKRRLAGGECVRATIVAAVLVGAFLLVFFVGADAHLFNSPLSNLPRSGPGFASQQQVESPNRHASILLFSGAGDNCEKRRFDNFTGRLMSDGYVSCEAELAHEYRHSTDNTIRMRGILGSFKR
jgi:hypothetical protein